MGRECGGPGSLLFSFFAELSDLGEVSPLMAFQRTTRGAGAFLLDSRSDTQGLAPLGSQPAQGHGPGICISPGLCVQSTV